MRHEVLFLVIGFVEIGKRCANLVWSFIKEASDSEPTTIKILIYIRALVDLLVLHFCIPVFSTSVD